MDGWTDQLPKNDDSFTSRKNKNTIISLLINGLYF